MFVEFFFLIKVAANTFSLKRKKKWRTWVSIPVPPACKAGALPFELIPLPRKPARIIRGIP